ncbi:hypothetical protein [Chroococcus sp. FPU101]|uniref:hypothetical protein n=1 Tax=Chroococcus sp. FPU101 TaxID=1974212 RepID=UPI001A8E39D8|nr:hypothetical protein [Chroococcus sp. FPU101]GFE69079.1 hypothetical protein CFPU101_16890 [Chroococcus sp. FPU101]
MLLTREQQQAQIDLLLIGMYHDNYISEQETELINQISEGFTIYIQQRIADIRKVKTLTQRQKLIENIAKRLKTKKVKQDSFKKLSSFLNSNELNVKQNSLMAEVTKIFNL